MIVSTIFILCLPIVVSLNRAINYECNKSLNNTTKTRMLFTRNNQESKTLQIGTLSLIKISNPLLKI